jgi:predicted metal-dependent peptidase
MEAERKLTKARISVMRSTIPGLRLWSGVMSVGTIKVVDGLPTAMTNGRDEAYGREFIDSLPLKQLAFVCLHEACHKALRHTTVYQKLWKEDPRLTNIACDYVVNDIIVKADPDASVCEFPKNPDGSLMGLHEPKFSGWSAKRIYDHLKQEQEGGGKGKGPPGDGFDEHDWEGASELSEEAQEKLGREIDVIMRRSLEEAKKLGLGKGDTPLAVTDLLRPQVDWRAALREFVQEVCAGDDESSWRKLNRRFVSMGIALPTMTSETVGEIVIGADLSGSMWGGNPSPTTILLTEIVSLTKTVKPDATHLLYWDTRVAGAEKYARHELDGLLASTRPKGGGGTNPQCVPDYLKEHKIKPQCVIMLTDGHVPNWGKGWDAPVLWIVIGNKGATPNNGRVLHIDDIT